MLKENDKEWLRVSHPGLVWNGEAVTGTVEFRAGYWRESNQFVILGDDATNDTGAVVLTGSFNIRIEERREKSTSRLPAVLGATRYPVLVWPGLLFFAGRLAMGTI